MRVLLVGGGGREAALAWRLDRSPSVRELLVTDDNPGFPARARRVTGDPVAAAAGADLVVVGPEGPLVDGLADRVRAAGVPCFGPGADGARLEASKAWTKAVLAEAGVPTAAHLALDRDDPALREAVAAWAARGGVVIKADGLAAGKGVVVCEGPADALPALHDLLARVGEAARTVVIEERLAGPETSVFALCDGARAVPLGSARDHKRLGEGDTGPNTGGMGAISPDPNLDEAAVDAIVAAVHAPVLAALRRRGVDYRGVLYAGLMLTADGPKVLEFNVRFGDPECQALMVRWEDDPVPWLLGAARGQLPPGRPRLGGAACCVVLAAAGYPNSAAAGAPIPPLPAVPGGAVFVAGARREGSGLVASGGRVLGATARADAAAAARAAAYAAADAVRFPGCQLRRDIGGPA